MIKEFGIAYTIVIVLLTMGIIMDVFSFIKCRKLQSNELSDYATTFIKYSKIIICLFFGVLMLYFAVASEMSVGYRVMHVILGITLLADSIVNFIIKQKYKEKR